MQHIGNRIRQLRKQIGFTQEIFVRELGISSSHLSKIEAGKDFPSNQLIKSISRLYDVSEVWLRTGLGTPFESMDEATISSVMATSTTTTITQDLGYIARAIEHGDEKTRLETYTRMIDEITEDVLSREVIRSQKAKNTLLNSLNRLQAALLLDETIQQQRKSRKTNESDS